MTPPLPTSPIQSATSKTKSIPSSASASASTTVANGISSSSTTPTMKLTPSTDRETLETYLLNYVSTHNQIDNLLRWIHQHISNDMIHDKSAITSLYDTYINIIKSLGSEQYVEVHTSDSDQWKLTTEGESYFISGTPEIQLYRLVSSQPDRTMSKVDAEKQLDKDLVQIGQTQCMQQRWLTFDKSIKSYKSIVSNAPEDTIQQQLRAVAQHYQHGTPIQLDSKQLDNLKRRKMISKLSIKQYSIVKGTHFSTQRKRIATDLTADMLKSGEWQDVAFKAYNMDALGVDLKGGTLHPLLKVRSEIRQVLLGMGFTEMSTNQYVESSFWNFDALYQPQQHPARDSHDTFFIDNPPHTVRLPHDYVERVKAAHENGGNTGSIGYRYEWKYEEALKNVLRTHTTSVSTRMLYKFANRKEGFKPLKLFSIDRVFRNETLDATHLAEFHQVEGVVADYGLTLGDLIGTIETFFKRIGISEMRFKPAYNPYTEPSMEIFGYSLQLQKWIEIGNSGMFRPEMLEPMGLPPNVTVIAWGLSLERPTMIKYGIRNIRDLFGHKVKLDVIRRTGIPRFDQFLPPDAQTHHIDDYSHRHDQNEQVSGGAGQYVH